MWYTWQDMQLNYTFTKSTKTIVFSGYTINSLRDIAVITDVTNWIPIYNFADGITWVFTYATQTLVLTYDTNTVAFANSDELVINLFVNPAVDTGLNTQLTTEQSPIRTRRTDPEAIIASAQTLTTSFADLWPEISCAWFNYLSVWVKCTVQQSTWIQMQALAKHTYAGTEEYNFPIEIVSSWLNSISKDVEQFPDWTNFLYVYKIKVDNCIPFVQLQVKMTTDWGTDGTIDTAYVCKGY